MTLLITMRQTGTTDVDHKEEDWAGGRQGGKKGVNYKDSEGQSEFEG